MSRRINPEDVDDNYYFDTTEPIRYSMANLHVNPEITNSNKLEMDSLFRSFGTIMQEFTNTPKARVVAVRKHSYDVVLQRGYEF